MDIEINFLRHAVALGECLHFGNAAKSVHLSQPALSRSISNLETKLGQALFIRKNKSIIATDYGRLFIEKAKVLLNKVNDFNAEMVEHGHEKLSPMVVGCGPYPAETIVASAVAQFIKQHQAVEIALRIGSVENMLAELLSGAGMQCIIAELSAVNLHPGLETTPMGSHPLVIVARAGHPLAGSHATLLQIMQYPFISVTRLPPRALGPLHTAWKTIPVAHRQALPALECSSLSVSKRVIMETDALMALQLSTITAELESGQFIILYTDSWLHLNYGFVQKKGASLNYQTSEFKRMLFKEESALAKHEKRLSKQYLGK